MHALDIIALIAAVWLALSVITCAAWGWAVARYRRFRRSC